MKLKEEYLIYYVIFIISVAIAIGVGVGMHLHYKRTCSPNYCCSAVPWCKNKKCNLCKNVPYTITPATHNSVITLKTLNYNVFSRWANITGYEGQDTRIKNIPISILAHPKLGSDIDIVTFDEVWCPNNQLFSGPLMCGSDKARKILINGMITAGWPYYTNILDSPGISVIKKPANGGSIIFSKWPIEAEYQYVYKNASGQDKNAAKGAVYVRIIKDSGGIKQAFNIFATHLQAWSTPEGREARQKQLKELHNNFLPSINIPVNGTEVVIYQGDMNIDAVLFPDEVKDMEKILHASLPTFTGKQLYSSDPSTNYLVGKDGAAKDNKCLSEYKKQLNVNKKDTGIVPSTPTATCTNIPTNAKNGQPFDPKFLNPKTNKLNIKTPCTAYCPCCPHEMLDYILYSNEPQYLQPISSTFEIIPLKSTHPLTYKWGWCEGVMCLLDKKESHDITGSDLSDHYPVVANFTFKPTIKQFPLLDGCKNNKDCHFKAVGKNPCYCLGAECTLSNKHVNGLKLGADSKVNNNCHYRPSTQKSCFCRPGGG